MQKLVLAWWGMSTIPDVSVWSDGIEEIYVLYLPSDSSIIAKGL